MKKLLTILLTLSIFTSYGSNFNTIKDSTISTIKSTATTIGTGIVDAKNYTDTSSLFKEMYSDTKKAVVVLAQQFKTTTEKVLYIIGKKYFIDGIYNLSIATIMAIILLVLIFNIKRWSMKIYEFADNSVVFLPIIIFGGVIIIVCGGIFFDSLYKGLQYALNPEYYVLQDIVNIVKSFKN